MLILAVSEDISHWNPLVGGRLELDDNLSQIEVEILHVEPINSIRGRAELGSDNLANLSNSGISKLLLAWDVVDCCGSAGAGA